MQWDASPNAGFTTVSPWLPLADDHRTANVAVEREDPASMLNLHRRLLELRRSEPALALGHYEPVATTDDLLAYAREKDGRRFLVALNLGSESRPFGEAVGRVVLSTHLDRDDEPAKGEIELRANEGV